MEVAALVIGIVPLVGLFTDCVDLFSYVSVARSFGEDYELLNIELDVEKLLLLQWAARVNLTGADHDKRIDEPAIQHGVKACLVAINHILNRGESIVTRFDGKPLGKDTAENNEPKTDEARTVVAIDTFAKNRRDISGSDVQGPGNDHGRAWDSGILASDHAAARGGSRSKAGPPTVPAASSISTELFGNKVEMFRTIYMEKDVERYPGRHKRRGKNTSLFKRVRWTISDKAKFEEIVEKLSRFIKRLDDLMPPLSTPAIEPHISRGPVIEEPAPSTGELVQQDLTKLWSRKGGPTTIKMLWKVASRPDTHLEEDVREAIQKTFESTCEQCILDITWFRTMDDRRAAVKSALADTFDWALHDSSTSRSTWDNFATWLKSGSGVYWMNGKAGSGKSTLMKYLWDHERTREYLKTWAEPEEEVVIESFFFWNLGTAEQKSYDGLRRALLHKILLATPSLVSSLLPQMWRDVYTNENFEAPAPSTGEVDFAFRKFLEIKSQRRYCFFIDGLDEYSGDFAAAINFVRNLAESSRTKFVISSRPISECLAAFENSPKLVLQELNRPDMEQYVRKTITLDKYEQAVEDMVSARALLQNLADKSSGIFLWTVLACQSILQGFNNGDTLEELEDQVNKIPRELSDLFRHMLQLVHPNYKEQGAQLLWLCHQQQLAADYHSLPIEALGLALLTGRRSEIRPVPHSIENMPQETFRNKVTVLEKRLSSRCFGLLEFNANSPIQGSVYFCDEKGQMPEHDKKVDADVVFIHRSVVEFLQSPEVMGLDDLKVHGDFDPPTLLAYISALLCRVWIHVGIKYHARHLRDILLYAQNSRLKRMPAVQQRVWQAITDCHRRLCEWFNEWEYDLLDNSFDISSMPEEVFYSIEDSKLEANWDTIIQIVSVLW